MDTSFGVLKGFLSPSGPAGELATSASPDSLVTPAPWNTTTAGFGLLRRASGFSIANVTASFPGTSKPRGSTVEDSGQQMVDVPSSRAGSILERYSDVEPGSELSDDKSGDEHDPARVAGRGDTRSVRSFSSMMSTGSKGRQRQGRRALSDRLAGSLSKAPNELSRETMLKVYIKCF